MQTASTIGGAEPEAFCWRYVDQHAKKIVKTVFLTLTPDQVAVKVRRTTKQISEIKMFEVAHEWITTNLTLPDAKAKEILDGINYHAI